VFARDCPGYHDQIVLLDSTGRVRPLSRDQASQRTRASVRAPLQAQPQPLVLGDAPARARRPRRHTPRGDPRVGRSVRARYRLRLFPIGLRGGETIVCDKGYAGVEFARLAAEGHSATILRPNLKTEPCPGPHLAPIRQSSGLSSVIFP